MAKMHTKQRLLDKLFQEWNSLHKNPKGVIRIRKLKDRQRNSQKEKGQRNKQRTTKHYTEN